MSRLSVVPAGRLEYLESWDLQHALVRARQQGRIFDTLLLTEHPPTYTIGRSGSRENLLIDESMLQQIGACCHEIDRGGDITFHGPGQLVGYMIHQLDRSPRSVSRFVQRLQQVIIQTLSVFAISGQIIPGRPGVWVDDQKIAAIGIAVSRGVTWHGFSLNVDPDLHYFGYMIPCGITNAGVTSMAQVQNKPVELAAVADELVRQIAAVFNMQPSYDQSIRNLQELSDMPFGAKI